MFSFHWFHTPMHPNFLELAYFSAFVTFFFLILHAVKTPWSYGPFPQTSMGKEISFLESDVIKLAISSKLIFPILLKLLLSCREEVHSPEDYGTERIQCWGYQAS